MPLLSHAEKLYAKDMRVITLVRGMNEHNAPLFCYIAVRADKLEEFQKIQASGEFYDPEDYGVVIESGEGEPDAVVRRRVRELFGMPA